MVKKKEKNGYLDVIVTDGYGKSGICVCSPSGSLPGYLVEGWWPASITAGIIMKINLCNKQSLANNFSGSVI